MKKIMLFMLFMSTLGGYSQVKNYTFAQTTGTYNEITEGTPLGDAATDAQYFIDPSVALGGTATTGVGIPMGPAFNFVFNGFTYNRFGINSNGWISLGSSAFATAVNMGVGNKNSPMISTTGVTPEELTAKIVALGGDLSGQDGSSISYITQGDAPNRVLVVQWEKFKKAGSTGTGDSFNFQIKLYETSNRVEIVYGIMNSNSTVTNFQVGLRAEPSATATNYSNRTSTTGWDVTTAGTAVGNTVSMNDTNKPVFGLTYTWTPPTCGEPKSLAVSAISTTEATLNWSAYTTGVAGYEYVVTTSSSLPTGSGTSVTNATATLTGLLPDTVHNVFIRSVCGTDFTKWISAGSFRTKCAELAAFVENFSAYSTTTFPYCWGKGGNGTVSISVGSPDNRLSMVATGGTSPTIAYAILPKMSNLNDETNRLKFKAWATTAGSFDVGYYTDALDVNTFTTIETINLPVGMSSQIEFAVTPTKIPAGVKCLGFRNTGEGTAKLTYYINDVIWEVIPPCTDVKSLVVSEVLGSTAKVSWTPVGTETAWQYVYAPSTVKVPSGLTLMDANSSTQVISGLADLTSYNVWVRSKCGDNLYGAWIGPANFSTICSAVTEFANDFDASTPLPACWTKLGSGNASTVNTVPASGPNVLMMYNGSATAKIVVAMVPVNNSKTHRLKFKLRGGTAGNTVEIGYLTDYSDASSFVPLQSVTATSNTVYDNIAVYLGEAPKSPYLAFRPLSGSGTSGAIYIDDVIWEPNTSCADISALTLTEFTSNTADLKWTTSGAEGAWEYAVGSAATVNPYTLGANSFTSTPLVNNTNVGGTISGLTPWTSYKVWVRSKCSSEPGAWIGPLAFKTTCAPVAEFTQNFDAGTAMPDCWSKAGAGGTLSVVTLTGAPSSSNVLNLYSDATSFGVVALPAVTNSADGDHVLRFKFRGNKANSSIEVGFLLNPNDGASFSKSPGMTFTAPNTTDFVSVVADLGTDPSSQVLAFRNPNSSTAIYIDDVSWEALPKCKDITNLGINQVTSTSVEFGWKKGDSETKWQYVLGTSADNDPDKFIALDVDSPFVSNENALVTLNNLDVSTSYRVWVRSKCTATQQGAWVGPLSFTTTCAPITEFSQNFDSGTAWPTCWSRVGSGGAVTIAPWPGSSTPNVLSINSSSNSKGVVAMPAVSNADAANHRLRFKLRGSSTTVALEVGTLTDISNPDSFSSYQSFNPSSTVNYDSNISLVVASTGTQVLAFRNPGAVSGTVFIDDVIWEPIPTCSDVKDVVVNTVTISAATVTWVTNGSANEWQYVVGNATTTDPNTLSSKTTSASLSLTDLTPGTTYKVWIRTKCSDTSFGVWSDPLIFNTPCATVTAFTQNFDASTTLSDCWFKVGSGDVTVGGFTGASAPNVLRLKSIVSDKAIVAMPNVSNVTANSNRLKFKFHSSVTSGTIEVGYVTDINDTATFVPLETYVSNSIEVFQDVTTTLETKPVAGSILAFRQPDTSIAYIDDVVWEPIPACANVVNVAVKSITNNSVQLSWDASDSATEWQYVSAASTVTSPDTLPLALIINSSSKAVTVDGLIANSSYKIWVRTSCGNGVYSAWAESAVFTTLNAAVLGNDIFQTNNFVFYPNPVKDMLNLSFNQEISNVIVTNLLGQEVMSKSVNANHAKIDMSHLSVGTYLVRITVGGQLKTVKVVKE